MSKSKGAVAAGHPLTTETAASILREGGNAFDAVVAAQLSAFVVEPVLTSLGGGGFLFAETDEGKQTVYDFFVQTPLNKADTSKLDFYPIDADFGEAQQEYRIGAGSVAVPGMIEGLFEIHHDLCSIPLNRLAEHAIQFARDGFKMGSFQSGIFDIVKPIYRSSETALEIFGSKESPGELIRKGEMLKQRELANTLDMLAGEVGRKFYRNELAHAVAETIKATDGHLTKKDFESYQVKRRRPLRINYKNHNVSLNPPPSSGGVLIGFALKLLESFGRDVPAFGSKEFIIQLAEVQRMTDSARVEQLAANKANWFSEHLLDALLLNQYKEQVHNRVKAFRGTTQISVVDGNGNKASLTSSNGEGSGVMIPGTGIMLNNMLGEEDLNPGGFHQWEPNQRVSSMMSPGILKMDDGKSVVFGSGGSNRIRTAILQLLLNLTDHDMSLKNAVNAPRLHFEKDKLNAENGFDLDAFEALNSVYPDQKIWKNKSLFFGGAHAVSVDGGRFSGAGDRRRGGASIVL